MEPLASNQIKVNRNRLMEQPPCLVYPALAEEIGMKQAIFIAQLHYWIETPGIGLISDGKTWVFNSYRDWADNIPKTSPESIKIYVRELKKKGILEVQQFQKKTGNMVNYYTINYEKFYQLECHKSAQKPSGVNYSMGGSSYPMGGSDLPNGRVETTPSKQRPLRESFKDTPKAPKGDSCKQEQDQGEMFADETRSQPEARSRPAEKKPDIPAQEQEFETVIWKTCPKGPNSNKKMSLKLWLKLSTKKQAEVRSSIGPYRAYCASHSWYSPKNLTTYLNMANEHWRTMQDMKPETFEKDDGMAPFEFNESEADARCVF